MLAFNFVIPEFLFAPFANFHAFLPFHTLIFLHFCLYVAIHINSKAALSDFLILLIKYYNLLICPLKYWPIYLKLKSIFLIQLCLPIQIFSVPLSLFPILLISVPHLLKLCFLLLQHYSFLYKSRLPSQHSIFLSPHYCSLLPSHARVLLNSCF